MEFGLFIQNYVPNFRRELDPDAEHKAIMEDLQAVVAADRAGFKYVWATEHHFLDEYSHLSANDVVLGYLAHATERIHLGSGIFNPLARVNHPAKVAERVAYLDHLSDGRFEFGTGRGAGSHEILGFLHKDGITDTGATRAMWEETIREFAKMFTQDTYEGFEGTTWSLPPRKILPKPYHKPHPPMWYACGNPSSYEMAGRLGLGVLGFSLDTLDAVEKLRGAYKNGIAEAEPVGAYVNDNLMCTLAAYVAEDSQQARDSIIRARPNYLVSNVFRYHDTFPHPAAIPNWPEVLPDYTPEIIDYSVDLGSLIVGDPDEALAQVKRWEATGVDQIVFGIGPAAIEDTLETIRLFGEHIIPKIDTDPLHRSTRMRDAAGPR